MIIGGVGAGKSTLTKALLNKPINTVKTQALNYEEWIIDTPGEYIENPLFYKNIMATSLEATHVIYLQDATKRHSNFPPFFSSGMAKLSIGVVTKIDAEHADIEKAIALLKGVVIKGPIILTSAIQHRGVEHVRRIVHYHSVDEMKTYVQNCGDETLLFVE